MFELFSPLYLLRAHTYETAQVGFYAQYTALFVLIAAVVEALVQSGVRFFAQVTGFALLWFQVRTVARLFLSYVLCTLVIFGVLAYLFRIDFDLQELFSLLGLAILPRVLAVYGLFPYIGRTLYRLLDVWTVVLLYVALQRGVGIDTVQILTCLVLSLLTYGVVYVVFSYLPELSSAQIENAEV